MGEAYLHYHGQKKFLLTVVTNSGATVTATRNGRTLTATANNAGVAVLSVIKGTWAIECIYDGNSKSTNAIVEGNTNIKLLVRIAPEISYTGSWQLVDDSDKVSDGTGTNWKIRFLTSGVLTFNRLNGADTGIDLFLVGGGGGGGKANTKYSNSVTEGPFGSGGGGGGGGYTKTARAISVQEGVSYNIVVGAGGGSTANGGDSSAFDFIAGGGKTGASASGSQSPGAGGAGGSNGGSGGYYHDTGYTKPGSDGNPGQGVTTREFGESGGKLYSGGGGGGGGYHGGIGPGPAQTGGSGGGANGGRSAGANTGGGGGGGHGGHATISNRQPYGGSGGSGIVIIRNKR